MSFGPVRAIARGMSRGLSFGFGMAKLSELCSEKRTVSDAFSVNPCVAGIRFPASVVLVRSRSATSLSADSQKIRVTAVGAAAAGGDSMQVK